MATSEESFPEAVYIRHVVAARRTQVESLDDLIKPPMTTSGSTTCHGGEVVPRSGYDWVVACRFPDRKWLALFSNTASTEELFSANSRNRRTEVARAEKTPDGTWVIHINRARKEILRFEWGDSDDQPSVFKSTELADNFLHGASGAAAGYRRLCQHYELPAKPRSIQPGQSSITVFGTLGTPIKTGIKDMILWSKRPKKGGTIKAAKLLDRGISAGDVQLVRKAISEGASLEWLPDSPITPLTAAVYKADETEAWREVAEAILEAGASVDGCPGTDPPIVSASASYVKEASSVEMTRFLLEHGADVNAQDERGETSIMNAIVHQRHQLLEMLHEAGADPSIPDQNGRSPLDWLRSSVADDLELSGYSARAAMLTRLTGEEVTQPAQELFTPELEAENERLRECIAARSALDVLEEPLDYKKARATDLRRMDEFPALEQEIVSLGFEPACDVRIQGWCHAAFTHRELNIDAVVYAVPSDGLFSPLRMVVDVGVYFDDGSHRSVSNGLEPPGGGVSTVFMPPKTGVRKLLKRLEKEVRGRQRMAIAPSGFAARHKQAVAEVLEATCERLRETLQPRSRADAYVPRFEKLGCFPDLPSDEDPTWCSGTICRNALEDLAKELECDSDFRLSMAIRDGADLLVLRHLEFAGEPGTLEFLPRMADAGLALFEFVSRTRNGFKDNYLVEELEFTLFALALTDRWDDIAKVSECLKPAFVSGGYRDADDLPRTQAKFWVLVLNSFREKAVQGSAKFAAAIRADRHPLPKRLLMLWEAIQNQDGAAATAALQKSLSLKTKPPATFREIWRFLALPQSILLMLAQHAELDVTIDLDELQSERLVTAQSLRM